MSGVLLLVLAQGIPQGIPQVIAAETEASRGRVSLVLVATAPFGDPTLQRREDEIVLTLAAGRKPGLALPGPAAPLEGVTLEDVEGGLIVHVRVGPDVPYELHQEGAVLRLVLGAAPAPQDARAELEGLYHKILAPPAAEAVSGGALPPPPGDQSPAATPRAQEGLTLGILTLRPLVTATLVDADATILATPQPVHDRYYEIRPHLGAEVPAGEGRLTADYEARIRRGSAFDIVGTTSQFFDAGLELPVGPRLRLRASEHYFRGALETSEVDPGGEYFFGLGFSTRNMVGAGARFDVGSRFYLDVGGSRNRVSVAPATAFVGYSDDSVTAALGFELGPDLRLAFAYGYDTVPAPLGRPEGASHAQTFGVGLHGEILPLLHGDVNVGYETRTSALAGPGGTSYQGVAGSVALTKEFSPASSLVLTGSRSTPVSSFEKNAFYVSTAIQAELSFPLPLLLEARAGSGYRANDYPTVASGIGMRRTDRVFGWSAGLGRPVNRWLYVTADYRWDRRTSDIALFRNTVHSFALQVGAGYVNRAVKP